MASSALSGKINVSTAVSPNSITTEVTTRRAWVGPAVVILAVGAFYLSTIRQGHDWGDDFSLYIHHARNLVEGKPYGDTGYIYNPQNIIGPVTYPPVYPLLLVPIYKVWGLNFTAMKVEGILFFLLALLAIYLTFRTVLPAPYPLALVALIGFNPRFWLFKDNVASDLPFLLFVYLSFYFIHKAYQAGLSRKSRVLYALLVGASIYLAYGTRSVGLVLVPIWVVYHAIRSRKLGLFGLLVFLLMAVLIYLQARSVDSYSAYIGHIGLNLNRQALWHCRELIQELSEFWTNGYSNALRGGIFVTLTGLAAVGYFSRVGKGRITCFELFVPFYLIPFIVFPIALDQRFLFPLMPLYLFYVFVGLQAVSGLSGFNRPKIEKVAFAGILLAVFASYAGQYTKLSFGPIQYGINRAETQQLYDYVRREIGEDEVVVCRKPRALSLFTRRAAAIWHYAAEDEQLWDFFRRIGASYLIVGPSYADAYDQKYIRSFVERNRGRLRQTYTNADFIVYRIVKDTT